MMFRDVNNHLLLRMLTNLVYTYCRVVIELGDSAMFIEQINVYYLLIRDKVLSGVKSR